MPRKAIWGSSLLLAAICVVAIVRAQDRTWQPRPTATPGTQLGQPAPLPLPVGSTADAMPVQFEQPREGTVPAGIFGRERRQGNIPEVPQQMPEIAEANPAEPRPFPPVNHMSQPPAAFSAPGTVPTRSVLRRPGQPAPMTSPSDLRASQPPDQPPQAQFISDESDAAPAAPVTPRSILKRPVGPIVNEAAPSIAPIQEAPAPISEVNSSSRRIYDSNSTAAPLPSINPGPATTARPQDVVIAAQSPRLRVELAGPQAILVGKSAKYVLNLVNDGGAPAEDVQLRLQLPPWVSVESGETTSGEATAQADGQGSTRMVWVLPTVKASSQETLRLQLVAAEGQPFELSADWTCKPATLKAAIVVRQPQLELSLAGPSDMTFGEEKPFTITISNPGNGDAEQVKVTLLAGGNAPQTLDVGTVAAGKSRDVNVKILANQPGSLDLKLTAAAEGNLRAEAAGRIVVKQPVLAVAVDGPPLKFAGAEAVYAVTVSNTGNAAADDLSVSVTLPAGAKYLGGIEGATVAGSTLKWKAGLLPPETERSYEIRCQLNAAGTHRCVVQAQGPRTAPVTHETETIVEAVSNLKLAVNDPSGPAPTGQDVTYEVQLMNRGTLAAKNVKIVLQFSEGVEPTSVQGAEARLVPGQVLFETLPELGAGEQVVVHVKAQAGKEGSHRFRVEVVSADNDTRLVSEGTTRFFTDARNASAAARTATKPKLNAAPTQAPTLQR